MSAEKNRATAIDFLLTKYDHGGLKESSVTADWRIWNPKSGYMDKNTYLGMLSRLSRVMPVPVVFTIVDSTAEGDRVALEANGYGKLTNGSVYANTYHFLFLFRGGKICEIREYQDTKLAADIFGPVMEQITA